MLELTDGSTAIVRGAMAAGCTFFAGYPITPASPILHGMMRELPKTGGTAIQGEDEIASIGMCIGATLGGARAMTATSGPGISLYSENIGLAIMGEVPLVIVDVQRLGPATGGATSVAQGDVQFVRWGTAGGYPLIVLAPSSIPECYHLTMRAFDLAERFRCPVIVLTDKELNLTVNTVAAEALAPEITVPPRGEPSATRPEEWKPYRYEPADGVPPLARYGTAPPLRFTGSTHDEGAFITKHTPTVAALNRHLVAKIEQHRDEIETVSWDPQPGAGDLIVSYGVTAGAMREAVRRLRREGHPISELTIQSLWPVPETALERAFDGIERVFVAELNTGQYRREIERLAGARAVHGIHRTDGELMSPGQITEAIR